MFFQLVIKWNISIKKETKKTPNLPSHFSHPIKQVKETVCEACHQLTPGKLNASLHLPSLASLATAINLYKICAVSEAPLHPYVSSESFIKTMR